MGTIKNSNARDLVDTEETKKAWKEYIYIHIYIHIKKILMNWTTTMVQSATYSQTFWSLKPSGPLEALLLIKVVEVGGPKMAED